MNQPYNTPVGHNFGNLTHPSDRSKQKTTDALVRAISDSNDVLVRAQTIFPLTLFPDTLTVDRTKVTITQRAFFNAGEVLSIRIEDILSVTAQVGPLFGSIKILTKFFTPDKPYVVDKLKRGDALRIKRILQGYLIARQNKIDTSELSTAELARNLDELGKVDQADRL